MALSFLFLLFSPDCFSDYVFREKEARAARCPLPVAGSWGRREGGRGVQSSKYINDDRYQLSGSDRVSGCVIVIVHVSPCCCNLKPTTSKNNCLPLCNNLFSGVNERFVHYNFAVMPRFVY